MKRSSKRFRFRFLAWGLAVASLTSAAPAAAQWFYEPRSPRPYPAPIQPYGFYDEEWIDEGPGIVIERRRPPPPDEAISRRSILRMLIALGYEPVSRLRRVGDVYRVVVEDRRGARLDLTIDAYDGHIIRRSRLASVPDGDREREPARPPRGEARSAEPRSAEPRSAEPPREPRTAGIEPPQGRPPTVAPSRPAPLPPPRPAQDRPSAATPAEARPAESRPAEPPVATTPRAPAPEAPAAAAPPQPPEGEQRRAVRVIEGVTPVLPRPEPGSNLGLPAPDVPPPATID